MWRCWATGATPTSRSCVHCWPRAPTDSRFAARHAGLSPLHMVASSGALGVAAVLLRAGVDPNACSPAGERPLDCADAGSAMYRLLHRAGGRHRNHEQFVAAREQPVLQEYTVSSPRDALHVLRERRDAACDALLTGRLLRYAERLVECLPLAAALPPCDSLAHADVLFQTLTRPVGAACDALPSQRALWRECAALLRARHAAGTLLTFSPGEASFVRCATSPLALLLSVAAAALRWALPDGQIDADVASMRSLPVPCGGAEGAELAALAIALCAGELARPGAAPLSGDELCHAAQLVESARAALDATRHDTPWAHADTFLFSQPRIVENTAAITNYVNAHLAEIHAALDVRDGRAAYAVAARRRVTARAAEADVGAASRAAAPGGLRRCALPSCGAPEREARQFCLCAGCGDTRVAYCCADHHRDDWKRHKRDCRHAAAAHVADKDAAASAHFQELRTQELRTDVGFCRRAYAMFTVIDDISFCSGVLAGLPDPDGPGGMAAPPPPFPADAPPVLQELIRTALVSAHDALMRSMRRSHRDQAASANAEAPSSRAGLMDTFKLNF